MPSMFSDKLPGCNQRGLPSGPSRTAQSEEANQCRIGIVRKGDQSAEPKLVLIIEPPRLLASMSHEERARCVMLLGLDAESPASDSLRLQLNVVFQPIAIRRGLVSRTDYFVATTGGSVKLSAPDAEVVDHTGPNRIEVEHDVSVGRETTGSLKLVPELKGKIGATDLEVKPGSVEHATKNTLASGIKFASEEMLLVPINLGDAVEWRIDSHRGEKAVRDFLAGNVYLEATFRWKSVTKRGSARVRPSDISFFDSSRRRLSNRASILMRFVLWSHGIHIANCDGIEVTFVEHENDRV